MKADHQRDMPKLLGKAKTVSNRAEMGVCDIVPSSQGAKSCQPVKRGKARCLITVLGGIERLKSEARRLEQAAKEFGYGARHSDAVENGCSRTGRPCSPSNRPDRHLPWRGLGRHLHVSGPLAEAVFMA